jgi:hypothetical protein
MSRPSFVQFRRPLSAQVAAQLASGQHLVQRLEKNPSGVPEEQLAIPEVTRKHGVRGVAGLLLELECGDTRPSRAHREAGAQAMA